MNRLPPRWPCRPLGSGISQKRMTDDGARLLSLAATTQSRPHDALLQQKVQATSNCPGVAYCAMYWLHGPTTRRAFSQSRDTRAHFLPAPVPICPEELDFQTKNKGKKIPLPQNWLAALAGPSRKSNPTGPAWTRKTGGAICRLTSSRAHAVFPQRRAWASSPQPVDSSSTLAGLPHYPDPLLLPRTADGRLLPIAPSLFLFPCQSWFLVVARPRSLLVPVIRPQRRNRKPTLSPRCRAAPSASPLSQFPSPDPAAVALDL